MPDQSDKKSDKKFANLHYPGMKADPNEGSETENALTSASVLILGPTVFGVSLARKLFGAGLGRVGMFGQNSKEGAAVLKELSAWKKAEMPNAEFEPFSTESIDRKLIDIARGFDFIVAPSADKKDAQQANELAQLHGKRPIVPTVKLDAVEVSQLIIEHIIGTSDKTSSP